ncbi:DUF763 domain-containing protein [Chitinophaga pinensis]|uniref:DUF763 domain-containing protein n=1 Tax=Chitinophaga pinensis (strain ATCC 43595 / DSM 2588 / LMG 13176 / NBRC 15968 / NCIMB 11800 / UQM 2034) TaxID=485918 RepID=A0A979G6E8_CHIPD|nr:DUF763 domain-containing protein [Chitinophaga pinensis]ACU61523.1 protein of unknown function DUF763 [Chitinophaga pinensis DSM 2588]
MSHADLPLHYGHVPPWLAQRMSLLGGAIVETIVADYGKGEVIRRLSDPCWFQALGCVLGMDWHSSGITTSVMGALKKALNPRAQELGIYICGGKGKHSRQTPAELLAIAERTGLPGQELVRSSKLAAKVDNTAIQDGFQLYLHSFIVSDEGDWAIVQQGMNDASSMARRYHWHSAAFKEYTESPHTFIYGKNQGLILNLTDKEAVSTKAGMLELVKEKPAHLLPEIRNLIMPSHHDVRSKDVDLKRLGSVLAVAHERQLHDFESLLLLEGVGPRTLQSLTLVSEVIHGTPSRFTDPARFSFAHGGKDGHPFPVPVNVYDETISVLRDAVNKAKIGQSDKQDAIRKLSVLSQQVEKDFIPNARLEELIQEERDQSWQYGGRTVMGKAQPPKKKGGDQLSLF